MHLLLALIFFIINTAAYAQSSVIDHRVEQEKKLEVVNFSLTPHKPNYLLPFVYNDKIKTYDVYTIGDNGENDAQQVELEFQISFKMPVMKNIADLPLSLYFAYSQVSFWQAYNSEISEPFRETNYEPEVFVTWQPDHQLGSDWHFKLASLGFTHQSNGRSEPLSRSWNRINASLYFENKNLVIALNPWYRFKESESHDNNPDLLDYYGHGRITAVYSINAHTISLMSRNNLESAFSKGALQATWSFPIHHKLRGYFKVFSGYGNSLIEYNQYTNTVGIGISLTDWL